MSESENKADKVNVATFRLFEGHKRLIDKLVKLELYKNKSDFFQTAVINELKSVLGVNTDKLEIVFESVKARIETIDKFSERYVELRTKHEEFLKERRKMGL